jgi:hypothetical protein
MPRYKDALEIVKRASDFPRTPDLEVQVDNLPFMADLILLCWADTSATPPSPCTDSAEWLADNGWSLVEILLAGAACLTEVQQRLYATTDGAVKLRDFTSPRKAASITS